MEVPDIAEGNAAKDLFCFLVCPGSAALQRRVNPDPSQLSRLQPAAQVCHRLKADSVNV
jgi:hypothetical protein